MHAFLQRIVSYTSGKNVAFAFWSNELYCEERVLDSESPFPDFICIFVAYLLLEMIIQASVSNRIETIQM